MRAKKMTSKKLGNVLAGGVASGLLFTSLLGCPGPEEPELNGEDVGVDSDVFDESDADADLGPFEIEDPYGLVPFQPGVDRENGHPEIEAGRPDGESVRVGRLTSDDTGFTGVWSHCREGDFLLSNHEVMVCIQSESTNRYETYTGGKFVDARRHDQPPGEDVLDMTMPLIDFGTAAANLVEVVRDGSDGVAVLRVTGEDIELAHLTGVLGMRLGQIRNLEVITEYRLEPGSYAVEMVTFLQAPSGRQFSGLNIGDWFAFGDRARAWSPGSGPGVASSSMPWVAGFGEGHSYGLVFEESAAPMGLASSQGIPYAEMRVAQAAVGNEEPTVMRRWFVVGDGSIDSVKVEAAKLRGEELSGEYVQIALVDEAGAAVPEAEVMIAAGEEWVTWNQSDADGALTAFLEPGIYRAEISGFAGPLVVEREFEVGEEGEITLTVPEVGELTISVREAGTEAPITSRVRFQHPDLPVWNDYAISGEMTVKVPAGELQLVVSRGLEYDLYIDSVTVAAGESESLQVELVRGVDTEGWRSGDFHQHMEPSIDSRLNVYTRVLENVSQGVELMVPTDHEVITDLQPVVDALGVGEEISTFPGVEISPVYAHFNLYPAPYRHDLRGRGSISLAHRVEGGDVELRRMPEIIEIARGWETDPVVQMNHPRNNSGMLNHVRFDPELGPDEVTHDDFTIDIDAIEVINRYGHICMVLADWSGLLNYGKRITGLGNSDSHSGNGEAGVPRNYMRTERGPGEIDADTARAALRSQRVSVGSHAFIDFGDGTVPGDEVQVEDGSATFHVRVQTGDWAHVETLFVIVNGSVVETIERTAEPGARFDFDEVIEVSVDEDSWVIFWADGPEPTAPIPNRKKLVAFTNPVYLLTGDGPWEAPGVRPLELEAIDTGYCD